MPNYCEGILRVRGKYENLKRFVDEIFESVELEKENIDQIAGKSVLRFKYNEEQNKQGYFMKGSSKYGKAAFGEFDHRWFRNSRLKPAMHVIFFKMYQGWGIEGNYIVKLARSYKLDMAIDSYESGCEHEGHVKVIDGQIIMNYSTEHRGDWAFDVPQPALGF